MAFVQRKIAGPPEKIKPCCKVGELLATLEPVERAAAEDMLGDTAWSAGALATEFQAEGLDVSDVTIHRHRTNTRGHVTR